MLHGYGFMLHSGGVPKRVSGALDYLRVRRLTSTENGILCALKLQNKFHS